MVKAGILGLGFMSVAHIKGYRQLDDVEIVAVCNPSGRRLDGDLTDVFGNVGDQEPVRLDMNAIRGYRDIDAFLDHPGLQMVDICTPTPTHADLAVKALGKGLHVLCEKPVTLDWDEAKRLQEALAQSDAHLMPAMCLRFWPEWKFLKDAVESGRYGAAQAVHFRRIAEPPAWSHANYLDGSKSGGALFDLHIHDTDFVRHCFGMPAEVFSTGFSKVSGAIDHVHTQYVYPDGPLVSAEGSWAMTPGFGFNMGYRAVFEKATIDYDIARGKEALRLVEDGSEARTIAPEGPDGYAGEIKHLAESITSGKAPTAVTLEHALDDLAIAEAEERSVKSRRIERVAR